MSFFINHRFGGAERDPPASTFPLLLDELEVRLEDEEHTSISVVHESEWGLGVYYGGYVTFEHVEGDGEPRHMRNVPREKVLDMMQKIASGDLPALEAEAWEDGY